MIIGFAGHARHGKDTCADVLVKRYGFHKRALADIMKESLRVMFGWTDRHLYGDLKDVVDPVYGISPRHALQEFGTGFAQHGLSKYDSFAETTGRKIWVNSLLNRVSGDTVISDVRFPHEAEAIREKGGIIVLVSRTGYPVDLSHESERAVDEITADYTVNNVGTLTDLEWQVCGLMNELLL